MGSYYSRSYGNEKTGERVQSEVIITKKALSTESPKQLDRTLTALDLTFLGIGAVIGTGIFVLTGIVAAKHSGPVLCYHSLLLHLPVLV